MQRGERQSIREGSQVRVSDLRQQFRLAAKPGKPAKAARHVKNAPVRNGPDADKHKPKIIHRDEPDRREELMAKAERLSQIHHTTSLLKVKPRRERHALHEEKRKKPGLFLQLALVVILAVGATIAIDPNLLPQEVRDLDWQGMKYQFDVWLQDVAG
jgi:hypothetical protein